LVHHVLVAARPQAVDDVVAGLEAEPVDTGDAHGFAVDVEDLVAAGVEVTAGGRDRCRDGDAVDADARRGRRGGRGVAGRAWVGDEGDRRGAASAAARHLDLGRPGR